VPPALVGVGQFEPACRESPQYRQFWEKLARGEPDSGEYLRIGRDGRRVWIQASYNPILDGQGRPLKVMKFATDITREKDEARMNAAFKCALDNVTANLMVADMDCDIISMQRFNVGVAGAARAAPLAATTPVSAQRRPEQREWKRAGHRAESRR
jgi:hypothetical protein